MGMSSSNWVLAARTLDDPQGIVVKRSGRPPWRYALFYQLHPDEVPVFLGEETAVGEHFPYGWAVEPD